MIFPEITIYFAPIDLLNPVANSLGLALIAKIRQKLPKWFQAKLTVLIVEGSHINKAAIDKQLNDKERVEAAMEQD